MGQYALTLLIFLATAVYLLPTYASFASERPKAPGKPAQDAEEVDTEHIFGFTEGADLGAADELEGESETEGAIGKRSGRYSVIASRLLLKYSVTDYFRFAPWVSAFRHDISGVPSFDDRRRLSFEGAGAELRFRLLNREHAPFGLTLSIDPAWSRTDAATGESVEQYGLGVTALIDKELVPNRVYAAFNAFYDPAWTYSDLAGFWEKSSEIGLAGC